MGRCWIFFFFFWIYHHFTKHKKSVPISWLNSRWILYNFGPTILVKQVKVTYNCQIILKKLTKKLTFYPQRLTRPPAQPVSSHWLQPDSTLTSTGPSPAGWTRSPRWPTRQPSSRTAARPTAKEASRPSSSGRWLTFRSNQGRASWTAASPPTSPNRRPRTENVYTQTLSLSPPLHT